MDYITSPGMWRGLDRDHEVGVHKHMLMSTHITCTVCGMPAHLETAIRDINAEMQPIWYGRDSQQIWYAVHGPVVFPNGLERVIELPSATLAVDSGNSRKRHLPSSWPKPVVARGDRLIDRWQERTLCGSVEALYAYRLGDVWMLKACELCKKACGFVR